MGLLDWLTSAERTQQMQGLGNNLKGAIEQLKQQRGLLDTASRDTITSMKRGGSIFPDTPAQRQLDQSIASGVVNSIGPLMFIGKGAKTWDAAAAAKAKEMLDAGVNPRQIWSDTGTWKGPDGHFRQEISDSAARPRDYQLKPDTAFANARFGAALADDPIMRSRAESMLPYYQKTKNQLVQEFSDTGGKIVDAALSGDKALAAKLNNDRSGLTAILEEMRNVTHNPVSGFLRHGELNQAYPDVYKMHTRIDPADLNGARGQYMEASPMQGEQLVLAERPDFLSAKSTMLHEIQHAIQQREGFARGGSPEGIKRNPLAYADPKDIEYAKTLPAYKNAADKDKFIQSFVQMRLGHPDDAYMRLAGEAEARATQARMNMDAAQRRATFPEDSYDVPIDKLIIRGGLLGR